MTNPAQTEPLLRLFGAIESLDVAAVVAAFTDDGVMNTPCLPSSYPRTRRGAKDIGETFGFLFAAVFKKFSWVDLEVHTTDVPGLLCARSRSNVVLTNGQIYANEYAMFAKIRNGRIAEYTEFFDTERAVDAFKHLAQ